MDIRYGNSAYLNTSGTEWTSLTFPFIDPRYRNRVIFSPTGIERPAVTEGVEVDPSMDFGTGTLPASVARNWTVMLSMRNTSTPRYSSSQHKIKVLSFQCPPEGCPLPPTATLRKPVLWSNPTSWAAGRVPRAGEDVLINSTMNILLDVSPPTLGTLTIEGRLTFIDFGLGSAPLTLSAGQVVVWGELLIGNATTPYAGSAHIVLYGSRASGGTVIIDDAIPPLGNKNIVVIGSFVAIGATLDTAWTRLAQTAAAGSSQIILSRPAHSWVAGKSVVVTPTNYNGVQQLEKLVIASVSACSALLRTLCFRLYNSV